MNTFTMMHRECFTGNWQKSEVLIQKDNGLRPFGGLYAKSRNLFIASSSLRDIEKLLIGSDFLIDTVTDILKKGMPTCEVPMSKNEVRLSERYSLTITESAKFFGIGENKLRQIAEENPDADWLLQNGCRLLIKREAFERMLNSIDTI